MISYMIIISWILYDIMIAQETGKWYHWFCINIIHDNKDDDIIHEIVQMFMISYNLCNIIVLVYDIILDIIHYIMYDIIIIIFYHRLFMISYYPYAKVCQTCAGVWVGLPGPLLALDRIVLCSI
jgi:hypothetical protein